ncbi:hypothetical protein KXD40_003189 [Peronospora effusa]|nr:hypothetical protein KXD40_003189 [Peronospora effusa]
MESGGRSGSGRGKGKKGKKKAINTMHQSGQKEVMNTQGMSLRCKASTPFNAAEEGLQSTKATQDQLLLRTKRKRLKRKKMIGGENLIVKEQMVAESGSLKTNVHVQNDQLIQNSLNAAAIVTPNEMSVKKAMKKKRKRKNGTLRASTGTNDSDQVMTTVSLKEGTSNDEKKSPLIATQPMKKKKSVRTQLPSIATVTKQTVGGEDLSSKRTIAQVENVSTKLLTQRTRKSERVTTTVDVSAAMASTCKKVEANMVSAGSMSMLSKNELQVVVKELKPKVQQSARGADASKQMDSLVNETLMLQQVPQADAAITAEAKDEVTITLCTNVTKTKQTSANADSCPSPAVFDDKSATSRPSTRDSAISSAAACLSTVHGKPVLQEPMPNGVTSPPTDIAKASPALVASAVSPQLTSARLVTTPIARSKVTSGRHKRRRSIGQAPASSITDPLQPPTKRSAGSSKDATLQSEANGPTEAQSSADGVCAPFDQLPNSPRHHAVPEPANNPVTIQEIHESAIMVVGGQATPTVEAAAPLSQSEVENPEKTEPVNVRRCATQPTQLLASMTPNEPAPDHGTSSVQSQARQSNDFLPSATRLESADKVDDAASATARSQGEGVGPQSIAASFESAVTKEVGIVMDSRTYVQKMMSTDTRTSSHDDSGFTQSVQSMTSLPPRPQNAWGASFGLVPPPPGASPVSRTLSTTPLSSWFLSKGCANFVKQVQFSDDDDAGDSSSSEEDVTLTRQSSTLHGADKAPIKRRASAAKKNAFLESLTTQSYWRTWYDTIDLHNLIDPPLAYVPDKLRTHEITPLSLAGPRSESDSNTSVKKSDLERLEADIRQEKQRGSAFSEQLLMMLQGKTVSGKSLEEEYRPLLR